jgi:hypothetical protein
MTYDVFFGKYLDWEHTRFCWYLFFFCSIDFSFTHLVLFLSYGYMQKIHLFWELFKDLCLYVQNISFFLKYSRVNITKNHIHYNPDPRSTLSSFKWSLVNYLTSLSLSFLTAAGVQGTFLLRLCDTHMNLAGIQELLNKQVIFLSLQLSCLHIGNQLVRTWIMKSSF